MDNEYVRCGDDVPCSVASDLRSRVRELEGGLKEIEYASKDIRRLAHTLLAQTKEAMPFMLLAPKPATPIPPDPRDAVLEAAAEEVVQAWDRMAKWAVRPMELLQVRLEDWRRAKDTVTGLRAALRATEDRG